jgi:hypothetical protein
VLDENFFVEQVLPGATKRARSVDVHDRIAAHSEWAKAAPPPRLFIDADPGLFIMGRIE